MQDTHPSPQPGSAVLRVALWACYLGCSWTWCIGMFMPALQARDFGLPGFLIFAVPNVIGAAAMGWVLRTPDSAARFAQKHAAATKLFSYVTIAFQGYFLGLFLTLLNPSESWPIAAVFAAALAPWFALRYDGRALALSLVTYAVSLIAAGVLASRGAFQPSPAPEDLTALLWLAPVSAFGFAFCPYLDLTFLRARRSLPGATGPAAFTLGFGVIFCGMIVLTYLVADGLHSALDHGAGLAWLLLPYGVHAAAQLAFTVGVHSRELRRDREKPTPHVTLLLACAALGAALSLGPVLFDLTTREIGYRVFLSAYGLVFPAYVWLCAIPTRDGHSGIRGEIGRKKLRILGAAIGLAAPSFAVGFIGREEAYLIPGILILVLARLALPRGRAAS